MISGQKPRVLLLFHEMIPSIELCGHAQMKELAARSQIEYRVLPFQNVNNDALNWADWVLLGRADDYFAYRLAGKLRKAGKTLIYILDDDLLNIPDSSTSAHYYHAGTTQRVIRELLRLSDAILSPSPRLLAIYAAPKQLKLLTEEPSLGKMPFTDASSDRPVKIGFAGSLDRQADVELMLKDVLIRLKNEYGQRVAVAFFGVKPSFTEQIDAVTIPHCDSYHEYLKRLGGLGWDIGLAPMPDSPFHSCKHYIKFIEYAAAGIMGVCSDIEPYSRARERFHVGVYCQNTAESWYAAIKGLIDDGEMRERMRRECYAVVTEKTDVATVTDELYRQMIALPTPRASKRSNYFLTLLRVSVKRHKAWNLLTTYGYQTPSVVWHKLKARRE